MNHMKKAYGALAAFVLSSVVAVQSYALESGFATAVDFAQAETDVNYVGIALIGFTLLMVGLAIVWRLAHSAKRA